MKGRALVAGLLLVGLAAAVGAWWLRPARGGPVTVDAIGDKVQTVPRGQLPVFASSGDTATLYRFAVERGEVLRWMPCTCGCGDLGHNSNRACYIKTETSDTVTFTSHAAT